MEPLGQSQVLPYLRVLPKAGICLELVSYEKPEHLANETEVREFETRLDRWGIRWTPLKYHAQPKVLSTVWDILAGCWVALTLARKRDLKIVHARSYVAALVAVFAKRLCGARFIFDMRGFWPEERVEMGIFRPGGTLFRLAKRFERLFLLEANQIIVLTRKAKSLLLTRPPLHDRHPTIEVIPCGVDLDRFELRDPNDNLAEQHGLRGKLIVGNIGAINKRYLLAEMFRFTAILKKRLSSLCFVYVTQQNPEPLYTIAREEGLEEKDLLVVRAQPEEVPEWLSLFQLGVFFLRPSHAAQGSSYTKLGEFLASGVPVVTNAGVGDIGRILDKEKGGFLLRDLTPTELEQTAERVSRALPTSAEARRACRLVAGAQLDVREGTARYLTVYRRLLGDKKPRLLEQERCVALPEH
jgi:glycosyltransferase involved in cell wall biosynthesis